MYNVVFHNGGHGICIDKTGGATLANNTIAFNANAGILIYESAAHIGNNVVVSNANCGINILPDEVSTVTLEHNDFWGNGTDDYCAEGPGENDISADPKFVNPDANDFHLLSDSPCVDAGTNVGAPSTDFDNDLRPLDGNLDGVAITDIGADEFRPYRIYLPLALKNYGS
jgi:parallel beta-helix repeat protein